ncbi:penicillin-binding transpeptidase domain-containing protein, partial [Patescibacteria group bacterium]
MESYESSKSQFWLPWFLRGLLLLGLIILVGRLVELQVIKGSYYRNLAEGNRIRRVPITAARGDIVARGGEVLVGNREVKKRVVFNPESGYEKVDDIAGAKDEDVITEYIRDYLLGSSFGHVSGYLGEVNEEEVGKIDPICSEKGPNSINSLVGRTGLEEQYNCILAGIDGEELVEVDTTGERIRTLGRREPVKGEDIKTSIDYGLQKKVAEAMGDQHGAVIVTDTKGEVLAMYSSPSYNPNVFVRSGNNSEIDKILSSEDLPLFNRAMGGLYHPGSVYKPIVAIAALEEGKIDEDYTYNDKGLIEIKTVYGDFAFTNWYYNQYGRTEGEINLVKAIGRSTDTFFYKLGEMLGIESLVSWSGDFGLDAKSGIDLPGEVAGLIPTPEWKERVKGERWFLGNTYHMSIGQGDLAVTPIAINSAIEAIASGGKYCTPSISGKTKCRSLDIKKENIDLVKKGMTAACTTGGTAFP